MKTQLAIKTHQFGAWKIEVVREGANFRYRFENVNDPGEIFKGHDRFATPEHALESAQTYLKGAIARLTTLNLIDDFHEAGLIDFESYKSMISSVRL
ncbi:hypothetical protein [Phormidesmis sp. 146-33]